MKPFGLFFTLVLFSTAVFAQAKGEPYVKGELLIKFREGTSKSKMSAFKSRSGVEHLQTLGSSGWQRVKLRGSGDVKRAAASLKNEPEIEYAQPNYYYRLVATPNDPQWGNAGLYGLPKISAPAAWDLTTGSSNVVVAVIDTGIRYTHEDLAANIWTNPGEIQGNGIDDDGNGFADDVYGYDFYFNDPDPIDEHGHGTHVAGTIGAVGNNMLGVVGVNWNVRMMAIKIYDADGFGTTSAMLVSAYNYIRIMKERGINIRVTNNSYAGCDEACGYDQATKDGIDAMGAAGILNVFAAGNNGWNNDAAAAPAYPAYYDSPSILSVASSTSTDARSSFSNWGPVSVDLAAPGSIILSTTNGSNSSYGNSSGTSMAAPHVAGAAALLAGYNPSLSVASLKATLMNSGDPLTGWDTTPIKTNGRLNVSNALQSQTVCSLTLTSSSILVSRKGGYAEIGVSSGPNCDFPITADRYWIRIRGTGVTSGSGTLKIYIDNSQYLSRTGSLKIGERIIPVMQGSALNFPKS